MSPGELKSLVETLKLIGEMNESTPDPWLPLYAALGGAIASFFPTWLIERRREKAFSKQIENCLISEISALLEIIDHRNYLATITNTVEYLKSQPKGTKASLFVDVPSHHSRVYQENCRNIGVVSDEKAKKIVIFHQLIDAVIQDIKPNGAFNSGAELETFVEMEIIFRNALDIGRELTKSMNEKATP